MRTSAVLLAFLSLGTAWAKPPAEKKKVESPCEKGDLKACFEQGKVSFEANEDPQALALFDKACTGGTLDACCYLGVMYAQGRGVTENEAKSAEIYANACKAGGALACAYEGRALLNGTGITKDPSKAALRFREGCDRGNMLACYILGSQYEAGNGVPLDRPRAAALFQKAIDGGEGLGLYGLGTMLVEGHGFPINPVNDARGFDLLSQACKRGEYKSCSNVGFMTLKGRGTKKDAVKAADFFEIACAKGKDPMACLNLGLCLEAGLGRPPDKKRGEEHIRFACDAGLKKACEELKP